MKCSIVETFQIFFPTFLFSNVIVQVLTTLWHALSGCYMSIIPIFEKT